MIQTLNWIHRIANSVRATEYVLADYFRIRDTDTRKGIIPYHWSQFKS